jgi:hypothetical protein
VLNAPGADHAEKQQFDFHDEFEDTVGILEKRPSRASCTGTLSRLKELLCGKKVVSSGPLLMSKIETVEPFAADVHCREVRKLLLLRMQVDCFNPARRVQDNRLANDESFPRRDIHAEDCSDLIVDPNCRRALCAVVPQNLKPRQLDRLREFLSEATPLELGNDEEPTHFVQGAPNGFGIQFLRWIDVGVHAPCHQCTTRRIERNAIVGGEGLAMREC